jgi:23S rRNA (guanosine2251-2'-O)-methyltransferase
MGMGKNRVCLLDENKYAVNNLYNNLIIFSKMADKPKKPHNKSSNKSGGGFKKGFSGKSDKNKKFDKNRKSEGAKKEGGNSAGWGKKPYSDRNSDKKPVEPKRYDGLKKFENRKPSRQQNDSEKFDGPKIFNEKTYRSSSKNEAENIYENKKPAKKYEQFDDNNFASKKFGEKKPYEEKSYEKKSWNKDSDRKPWDKSSDKPWEKKKFGDKKFGDKKFDKKPWEKNSWDKKPKSGGGEKGNFAADGKYYIYGKHPALLAIANPKRIIKKILCSLNSYNFLIEKLGEEAAAKIPHEIFDVKQLDRMLPADSNHQGIILESEPLEQKEVEEVLDSKILVLLDQITDPHNVGAIIRSSAAFGAGAVITTERASPPENSTIIKTSAGTFENMPYIRGGNLNDTILKLKDAGFYIIGLAGEAELDIKAVAKNSDKVAIIIGAEGKGLRELVGKNCDALAKINIAEGVESLNASVAAAVALFAISN